MPPAARAGLAGLVDSDSDADFSGRNREKLGAKRQHVRSGVRKPAKLEKPTRNDPRSDKSAQRLERHVLGDRSNFNTEKKSKVSGKSAPEEDEIMADHSKDKDAPVRKVVRRRPGPSERDKNAGRQDDASTPPRPQQQATHESPSPPAANTGSEDMNDMDVDEVPEALNSPESEKNSGLTSEVDYGANDSATRRKLGDMTRKYESLEKRHRNLREVGLREAERNFERLRKQSEENTSASDKLITELKAELSAKSSQAEKCEVLRQQLDEATAGESELKGRINELSTSLSDARREIRTLSAKLAASRSADAQTKAPGSALKSNAGGARAAPAEVVQVAQAKEDLYGDLTGLIVRGLTHNEDEDVFDCIQTGRNGTLHFKLCYEKGDGAESYDDVQLRYRPQLDENRDSDLMDILPDYLVEDIEFPRLHASKFYARVMKWLSG